MTPEFVEPEWAMATIVFVDIRGFTALADRVTAREAVAYLTEFFGIAVPVIERHGGSVNKLLGDGFLAMFGAPVRQDDHANRAVAAGRELLAVVDAAMGERCRVGLGMNSGLVLVGTMGAGGVTGLEVVGDPVNVASRVQGATRDLGEELLLTEATRMLLEPPAPACLARGTLELRGKASPTVVYSVSAEPVTISGRPTRRTEPV